MSNCKLDHSLEDVRKKLSEQTSFIQDNLVKQLNIFLEKKPSQQELNELFHLLKKYDLSSAEERHKRNVKMTAMLN